MNLVQNSGGFEYTRENGTVEYAPDVETAQKLCPILGKMSLEQAGFMFQLAAIGNAVEDTITHPTEEVIEDTDLGLFPELPGLFDEPTANSAPKQAAVEVESRPTSEVEPRPLWDLSSLAPTAVIDMPAVKTVEISKPVEEIGTKAALETPKVESKPAHEVTVDKIEVSQVEVVETPEPEEVSEAIEIKETETETETQVVIIKLPEEAPVEEVVTDTIDSIEIPAEENEIIFNEEQFAEPEEIIEEFTEALEAYVNEPIVAKEPETKIEFADIEFTKTEAEVEEVEIQQVVPPIIIEVTRHLEALEPEEQEVIAPILEEIIELIESTPIEELEMVDEELEKLTEELFEATKIHYEEEDVRTFIKVLKKLEFALPEDSEEDEIQQVLQSQANATTAQSSSKSKLRRLIGMFATLLHVEYTPV